MYFHIYFPKEKATLSRRRKVLMGSDNKEVTLTAAMIKEVRITTRAGTLDCKDALIETKGNTKKAIALIKKLGKDRPHKVYV
jgi:hypothetical protein